MEPREGEIERVEWVEGSWAVEELEVEVEGKKEEVEGEGEGGEGSKTPTRKEAAVGGGGGGFDGLPGSGSVVGGLGLMGGGGEVVEKKKKEVAKMGRGKVLFGLERLDRESSFSLGLCLTRRVG